MTWKERKTFEQSWHRSRVLLAGQQRLEPLRHCLSGKFCNDNEMMLGMSKKRRGQGTSKRRKLLQKWSNILRRRRKLQGTRKRAWSHSRLWRPSFRRFLLFLKSFAFQAIMDDNGGHSDFTSLAAEAVVISRLKKKLENNGLSLKKLSSGFPWGATTHSGLGLNPATSSWFFPGSQLL